ncbi:MAG: hypothetical protein C0599_12190 [Salinivirgaceae bacterium]|nr:MAG: hypothetical protein C0599_12190 [Salinivirgaceae bacterium]
MHVLSVTDGISAPFRLDIQSNGTIYVTDVVQNNIVKYDKAFNLIGSFTAGTNPGAIAINSNDEVFVGDAKTGIIYKMDAGENPVVFSTRINEAM